MGISTPLLSLDNFKYQSVKERFRPTDKVSEKVSSNIKDDVETALESVAIFLLKNYSDVISFDERSQIENLKKRNLSKEQIGYGIKFIKNAKGKGFVILDNGKGLRLNFSASKISTLHFDMAGSQIQNIESVGKKAILLSSALWDKILEYYDHFDEYNKSKAREYKTISVRPPPPPPPPGKETSDVFFSPSILPQSSTSDPTVSTSNSRCLAYLNDCLCCFMTLGLAGLITYVVLRD